MTTDVGERQLGDDVLSRSQSFRCGVVRCAGGSVSSFAHSRTYLLIVLPFFRLVEILHDLIRLPW
jgi:hypothetical protein